MALLRHELQRVHLRRLPLPAAIPSTASRLAAPPATDGYSVGQPIVGMPLPVYTDGTTDMLIVGGDLYDGYFGVNGNIVYGGTRYDPERYMSDGNVVYQATNITFDASGNVSRDGTGETWLDLYARVEVGSTEMAALEERGVVVNDFTQEYFGYLTGADPWLNVFHVRAEDWSMSQSDYIIEAPADSVVLVNIYGTDVSIVNSAMRLSGIDSSHVIFNYVDATNIVVESFTHEGSVVAPYASAQLYGGSIDGSAIFGGDVETALRVPQLRLRGLRSARAKVRPSVHLHRHQ